MPTYRVETNQGTFDVEVNQNPSSQEELQRVLQEYLSQPSSPASMSSHKPSLETMPEPTHPIPGAETISAIARPTLELGGLTAGALAGGTLGGGIGAVPGAGLGYAGGKSIADILDWSMGLKQAPGAGEVAATTAKAIGTGAGYEMGGQVVSKYLIDPALRWLSEHVPVGAAYVRKKAQDLFLANISKGPVYEANAAEARAVQKETGVPFTLGEIRNDPKLLTLQKALPRSAAGTAPATAQAHIQEVRDALKTYMGKNFSDAEVEDWLNFVAQKQATLEASATIAKTGVEQGVAPMAQAPTKMESGQKLYDVLSKAKEVGRIAKEQAYANVPETEVPVSNLLKVVQEAKQPFHKVESPENFPPLLSRIQDQFGIPADVQGMQGNVSADTIARNPELFSPKGTIPLSEMEGIRKEALNEMRKLRAQNLTDKDPRIFRLSRVAKAADEAIAQAAETGGEATAQLRAARKVYKEEYLPFKQGTVGEVMRPGKAGEQTADPKEQLIATFFQKGGETARADLIKTLGGIEPAREALRDYAMRDMIENTMDDAGNLVGKKYYGWISKNARALNQFKILDEFRTIVNAQRLLDRSNLSVSDFSKSVAAKALGTDPEKAMVAAMRGTDPTAAIRSLVEMTKGNPLALKGLQRAFADTYWNSLRNAGETVAYTPLDAVTGNSMLSPAKSKQFLAKYGGAMRILYGDSPEKMSALLNMNKAIQIASGSTKPVFAGGSDTAENISQIARNVGAAVLARTSRGYNIVRHIINKITAGADQAADEMLIRATFDPDYADAFISASKGMNPKLLEKKIISLAKGLSAWGKEIQIPGFGQMPGMRPLVYTTGKLGEITAETYGEE
jgi:hypothetical protein